MPQDDLDYWAQWERLLDAAAEIQALLPGAVLVGGSAASVHVQHRFSFHADYILSDLRENYSKVLDFLEGRDDWETVRINPPKLILGNFRGVETGIRQLIRHRPLETQRIEVKKGKIITIPTMPEMLRTKAWMIISRNAARDFIDFAALAERLGEEKSVEALQDLDDYYSDLIRGKKVSPLVQLIRQLAEPLPPDLDEIDLSRYKGIRPPYNSWDHIVGICNRIAVALGIRIAEGLA